MRKDSPLRVIITGASSGIGAALAKEYSARGATLGLVARRKSLLDELAAQLSTPTLCYPVDVRDSAALNLAAQDFMQKYGCPDIVVANAGVSVGNLTELDEDLQVFQDVMDINVMGMVKTFQPFVAEMRKVKRGTLVGIASVAGFRGLPGAGAYSASKAAAISYLESLRVELHSDGISVITICPGYVETPMTQNNPYSMPFIISAETAAKKIAGIIAYKPNLAVIPWQMAILSRLFKHLPDWLYKLIFSKIPRKPRRIA